MSCKARRAVLSRPTAFSVRFPCHPLKSYSHSYHLQRVAWRRLFVFSLGLSILLFAFSKTRNALLGESMQTECVSFSCCARGRGVGWAHPAGGCWPLPLAPQPPPPPVHLPADPTPRLGISSAGAGEWKREGFLERGGRQRWQKREYKLAQSR